MIRKNLKISNNLFLFLTVLICFILAAVNFLRSPSWSLDVIEYQYAFDKINELNFNNFYEFLLISYEPAFVFSSVATGYFTENVNVILFAFAFVSLLIKLVLIPTYYIEKPIILIVTYTFTYYILLELTQSRVAIASGIIILGYHFLISKRIILFVAAVILASLFHYTAIIAITALLFRKESNSYFIKEHLQIFLIIFLISILFKTTYIFSLIEMVDAKKASYLSTVDEDLGTGYLRVVQVLLYQLLILFVCRPVIKISNDRSIYRFQMLLFNLYATSISLYIILHSFGVVAVRLAEIFRNLEPFLLVLALSNCSNNRKKIVTVVLLLSIFVNLQKNNHAIYPLNYIFNIMSMSDRSF